MQYVVYVLMSLRPREHVVIVIASLCELSIRTAFMFTDFINFLKTRAFLNSVASVCSVVGFFLCAIFVLMMDFFECPV